MYCFQWHEKQETLRKSRVKNIHISFEEKLEVAIIFHFFPRGKWPICSIELH